MAQGPESRFSKKLRDVLEKELEDSMCVLLQDAYRGGTKPADFFLFHKGEVCAVELKVGATPHACLKALRENQKISLRKLDMAGICSLVVCKITGKKQAHPYIIYFATRFGLPVDELDFFEACEDMNDLISYIAKAMHVHYHG